MELKVHDIVKWESIDHLEKTTPIPDWVYDAPAAKNYGVVRRMPIMNGMVPIGLRGSTREQRFGTFIHQSHIVEVMTPVDLVDRIEGYANEIHLPPLKKIKEAFEQFNLRWGPTGSVGFELATGISVTTERSDIDVCIYMDAIDRELLAEAGKFLETLGRRIDVQVELASVGAFLLNDFLKHEKSGFVLRTPFGPQLCTTVENRIRLLVNH
ncbi:malonate decarboxylase holo-ACP synthase [Ureibacillus sp. FSL W7-1570]|uniref:malonate decarboxylase holo-ACP synthase n=1 Tax=Ureibacillus sp. FSL W7-1570 TaxID=2954593 RepID=UPI00315B1555